MNITHRDVRLGNPFYRWELTGAIIAVKFPDVKTRYVSGHDPESQTLHRSMALCFENYIAP